MDLAVNQGASSGYVNLQDEFGLPMAEKKSYESLYEQIKCIGRGAFGVAMLVRRRSDGHLYVDKQICVTDMTSKEKGTCRQEINILSRLKHHPNIVTYHDSMVEDGLLHILTDYCDGGDLAMVIQNAKVCGSYFSEREIMVWFIQMALGLRHVHQHSILHRDLKCQNIFLSKGNVVKIGDFGISRVLSSNSDFAKTVVGTPYYLSPELCEGLPYNEKSDVWALGCVLYEMASLNYAFGGSTFGAVVLKIIKGEYNPMPSHYSAEMRKLVAIMLKLNPNHRPSMDEVIRSDWCRRIVAEISKQGVKGVRSPNSSSPESMQSNLAPQPTASEQLLPESSAIGKHSSSTSSNEGVAKRMEMQRDHRLKLKSQRHGKLSSNDRQRSDKNVTCRTLTNKETHFDYLQDAESEEFVALSTDDAVDSVGDRDHVNNDCGSTDDDNALLSNWTSDGDGNESIHDAHSEAKKDEQLWDDGPFTDESLTSNAVMEGPKGPRALSPWGDDDPVDSTYAPQNDTSGVEAKRQHDIRALANLVDKSSEKSQRVKASVDEESLTGRDGNIKSRYRSVSQPSVDDEDSIHKRQLVEKIRLEKEEARRRRYEEEAKQRRLLQQERAEKRKERQKMFDEATVMSNASEQKRLSFLAQKDAVKAMEAKNLAEHEAKFKNRLKTVQSRVSSRSLSALTETNKNIEATNNSKTVESDNSRFTLSSIKQPLYNTGSRSGVREFRLEMQRQAQKFGVKTDVQFELVMKPMLNAVSAEDEGNDVSDNDVDIEISEDIQSEWRERDEEDLKSLVGEISDQSRSLLSDSSTIVDTLPETKTSSNEATPVLLRIGQLRSDLLQQLSPQLFEQALGDLTSGKPEADVMAMLQGQPISVFVKLNQLMLCEEILKSAAAAER